MTSQTGGVQVSYLTRFPHIGESRARKLVEAFGANLWEVLRDKDTVQARVIPILSVTRANWAVDAGMALHARADEVIAELNARAWFESYGIDDVRVVNRVIGFLRAKATEVLSKNPYSVARALPWADVDRIGQMVLKGRQRAPERLAGACDAVLGHSLSNGHTAIKASSLRRELGKLVGRDAVEDAILAGLQTRRIVEVTPGLYQSPGARWMEANLACRLRKWGTEQRFDTAEIDAVIGPLIEKYTLSDEQGDALRHCLSCRASAVKGGAGTGKTQIAMAIIDGWEQLVPEGNVILTALAGKAAMVIGQRTGKLARTIYRLLRDIDTFQRLIADGKIAQANDHLASGAFRLTPDSLVVMDEASMTDIGDWAKLTQAIENAGATLILLGDEAQLAPVGPGAVFHVLAGEKTFTKALTIVRRQAEGSGIPVIAKAVREGRSDVKLEGFNGLRDGVTLVPVEGDLIEAAIDTTNSLAAGLGEFPRAGHSLQIVAALTKTCREINERFVGSWEPSLGETVESGIGNRIAIGDPVINTKNIYKDGLSNGMLGYVRKISRSPFRISVEFDGRKERYDYTSSNIINLEPAYCLTGHKLQGSQAHRGVIVLDPCRLIEPCWIYTAITRFVHQVVIVGSPETLRAGIEATPSWQRRVTAFGQHLRAH